MEHKTDEQFLSFINIIFDGPPGHEPGRFVEVENDKGESISIGEWVDKKDGYWALHIPSEFLKIAQLEKEIKSLEQIARSQTSYQSAYDQLEKQLQSDNELNKALIFYHKHSSCIFCNGTKIMQSPPSGVVSPCEACVKLEQLLK